MNLKGMTGKINKKEALRYITITVIFCFMILVWPLGWISTGIDDGSVKAVKIKDRMSGAAQETEYAVTAGNERISRFSVWMNSTREEDKRGSFRLLDEGGRELCGYDVIFPAGAGLYEIYPETQLRLDGSYTIRIEVETEEPLIFELSVFSHQYHNLKHIVYIYAAGIAAASALILAGARGGIKKAFFYAASIAAVCLIWYFEWFSGSYLAYSIEWKRLLRFILCGIALISFLLLLSALKKRGMEPEKVFVIQTLIWGMLYMAAFPVFSCPDEPSHFATANKWANVMMGKPALDGQGNVYVRSSDALETDESHPNALSVENYYRNMKTGRAEGAYIPLEQGRDTGVTLLYYFPQSVGILAARILGLNFGWTCIAGRGLNLLFFILLAYWAIKMIPSGKWFLFLIAQLPMTLELAASFSYDAVTLGVVFVFFAKWYSCYVKDETLKIKDYVILTAAGVSLAILKVVYLPFLLLVWLLPAGKISREGKWKAVLFKCAVTAAAVLGMYATNRFTLLALPGVSAAGAEAGAVNAQWNAFVMHAPGFTVKDLWENKFLFLEIFLESFRRHGEMYFSTMIGGKLGWLDIDVPSFIIAGFACLLLLAVQWKEKRNARVNGGVKAAAALIGIACAAAVLLSMLLSTASIFEPRVGTVQGRYFLPILPVLLLLLPESLRCVDAEGKEYILYLGANFLNVLVIMNSLYTIVGR